MANNSASVDRYAQAIVGAMVDRWQTALGQFAIALESDPALSALVADTSRGVQERADALLETSPADTPAEITNLVKLLIQNGDLGQLHEIAGRIGEVAGGQQALVKAEVTSATSLNEDEKQQIQATLATKYGEGLLFSFAVDQSLLGGLRVRIGDQLIDNSVATRLAGLREQLSSAVR